MKQRYGIDPQSPIERERAVVGTICAPSVVGGYGSSP